jgi:hypothetical protein
MPKATTTKRSTSGSAKDSQLSPAEKRRQESAKAFDKMAKAEAKLVKQRKLQTPISTRKGSNTNRPAKGRSGHSIPPTPFRDLEKDGVTYSFLSKFLMDREQARLTYVEGLQRAGCMDALDFGSCFHELLEHFAEGSDCSKPCLKKKLDTWLSNQRKWRALQSEEYRRCVQLADQVLTIFPHYLDYWKAQKGDEHKSDFVCQEQDFRLEHLIPWQLDPDVPPESINHRKVIIRGRFDAIFRLKGKLWLMENKTKSQIDEEGLSSSLHLDLQTMLYCQAIRTMYGEAPEGVLYNVIRRPALRQGKTTYNDFLNRIEKDVIDNKSWYFMRWRVTFGKNDLDRWVANTLNPLLTQVCLWWDEIKGNPFDPFANPNRVHHFVNPEALYSKYGRSEFFEYLTRGSMNGLSRRTK